MSKAHEPSTILYENLAFTKNQIQTRKYVVLLVLGLLMLVSYKYQLAMHQHNANMDRFEEINCEHFEQRLLIKNNNQQAAANADYQMQAFDAWTDYYENNSRQSKSFVAGSLDCFCSNQYQKIGIETASIQYSRIQKTN